MTLKQQQAAIDEMKWYDSIEAGTDRCGSYDFCANCVRTEQYPCARAAKRKTVGAVRVAVVRKRK